MKKFVFLLLIICNAATIIPQDNNQLPLYSINDLMYKGAFRLPADEYGPSSMNYAQGPIAYNQINNSIFIVGHAHQQGIAEFGIPDIINSTVLTDLTMAAAPIQSFVPVLDAASQGNPQAMDRIGGISLIDIGGEQKLMVNAHEYYDAPADNTLSTLIIENPADLANSEIEGYYHFEGGAGHTSGWLSPVPAEWQNDINGEYITGQSSGQPIISRLSVGPSAYSFYPDDIASISNAIPTTELLDFSLTHPLHADLDNATLENDLWTHLSRVTYGFIVPGTRTYMTIGYSGGHQSSVCYKCEQNNGVECPGYCPPDTSDYNQYYWLWDMQDLLDVKDGLALQYDVLPYEYGVFETPFQNDLKQIGGASFDPASGNIYMTIQRADDGQGPYANPPVVAVYGIDITSAVDAYLEETSITLLPNPTNEIFEIRGLVDRYRIQIVDSTGQLYQNIISPPTTNEIEINLADLPSGLYFISIVNEVNSKISVQKIIKE